MYLYFFIEFLSRITGCYAQLNITSITKHYSPHRKEIARLQDWIAYLSTSFHQFPLISCPFQFIGEWMTSMAYKKYIYFFVGPKNLTAEDNKSWLECKLSCKGFYYNKLLVFFSQAWISTYFEKLNFYIKDFLVWGNVKCSTAGTAGVMQERAFSIYIFIY